MVEDFPCLRAVDVNPLLADAAGVIALDATMEIEPAELDLAPPNPRPGDPALSGRMAARGGAEGRDLRDPPDPADRRAALSGVLRAASTTRTCACASWRRAGTCPSEIALRLTQLDYDRDMAFVALAPDGALAGVSRLAADPDRHAAEYALLVRFGSRGAGARRGADAAR